MRMFSHLAILASGGLRVDIPGRREIGQLHRNSTH